MDSPTDTHRHLSHLVGLYPGYAVASFNATAQSPIYTNSTLQHYTPIDVFNAAEISLIHRGNGTGPDADSGWEKVWRAAAWAQLANATAYYHELSVRFLVAANSIVRLLNVFSYSTPSNAAMDQTC